MLNSRLEQYLSSLETRLKNLPADRRTEEVAEICQHLDALVAGHLAQGKTEPEAVDAALRQFGRAEEIGGELKGAWAKRDATGSRNIGLMLTVYLVSVAAIFAFFATANDKPTDFPYALKDQILLALVLPMGIFVHGLLSYLSARKTSRV